jgi:hypothetical protein
MIANLERLALTKDKHASLSGKKLLKRSLVLRIMYEQQSPTTGSQNQHVAE